RSRACTVGSSPRTSSPTSAAAIACRIAGVGRVTVSLLRSIIISCPCITSGGPSQHCTNAPRRQATEGPGMAAAGGGLQPVEADNPVTDIVRGCGGLHARNSLAQPVNTTDTSDKGCPVTWRIVYYSGGLRINAVTSGSHLQSKSCSAVDGVP